MRVQLFRFIDALPALKDAGSIRRHLAEYLAEAGDARSLVAECWRSRLAPEGTTRAEWLAAAARTAAGVMARKFIAGATPDEALQTVLGLRRRKLAFTADLLGEAVISEAEADWYQQTCLAMIDELAGPLSAAPEVPLIDRDQHGPIPRVNLSLKLSSLTAQFEPIHAEASIDRAAGRLRPILRAARDRGAYVHVDMEQYTYRALTYELFRRVLAEPEFRDWPDVGIVVQAYHPEAEAELRMLRDWVESRGAPITIRLVKGAYWDYEVLTARRLGWPEPVYLEKWQSDASFERCTRFLLEHHDQLRPAFGSHNVRSLAHAIAAAEAMGLPRSAYELQTLYGMGDADPGRPGRPRAPGARLYALRRHAAGHGLPGAPAAGEHVERVVPQASFAARARIDDLLRDPEEIGAMLTRTRRTEDRRTPPDAGELPPFRNEPPTDFARAENREAMRRALEEVRGQLGRHYPLIDRRPRRSTPARDVLDSLNPSHSSRVVGETSMAGAEHADAAVAAARAAHAGWAATAGPRPRRGPRPQRPRSSGRAGSSWPRGRSTSAASPGPRPTATSPRRSTSASSTPAR